MACFCVSGSDRLRQTMANVLHFSLDPGGSTPSQTVRSGARNPGAASLLRV